jgi:uncharacterized repeat protein (TIGR01451 family)
MVLVAGLTAIPAGVLPGPAAFAATAVGAGGPHHAVRVQSPAAPALTISVGDGRKAANAGDRLTYLVSVKNGGTGGAPHLKITLTLSAGLDFLSASPHAVPARGQVAWSAGIPAGGTGTFHVAARVARTPPRLLRLATVACASAQGGSRPIVCAAHLDRLPAAAAASAPRAAGPAGTVPLGWIVAALAALAAGVLGVIARRRRWRLRRQPD